MKTTKTELAKPAVTADNIQNSIRLHQGQKVLLDFDLAALYGVTTGHLNRAVKRNANRFPTDFMYIVAAQDATHLICQFGTSKSKRGGRRKPIMAFTQEGVAMLSSVLRSERAALVNIEIMRAFVRLRSLLTAHADLARRLDDLEMRYDEQFRAVFEAIRELMAPPEPPRKQIGFAKERRAVYSAPRRRK
jgi:hypothetical protein